MNLFDEWDGVVYDLDGTVVILRVDWPTVEELIRDKIRAAGIETNQRSVWTILEIAAERDVLDRVEPTLNRFEIEGAGQSERLPLADSIPHVPGPVGICSLNCEAACRRAIAVHDLNDHVDAIIGRDTVRPWKPDPAPLEAAVAALGTPTDSTVFVGDSESDAQTAKAADIPFRYVSDVLETTESS